ncbi:tudor domain-containing protein 1 isoform X2 [Gadus morhua]|uniref:tudor domain-containing protein 1 isoform X2 n=1 Tax=Gadus morhua TaxID=8049 RepID=UPI0011B39D84|nr:tudor domain-containing protein 1 isoform X2 [Gadus morhua]
MRVWQSSDSERMEAEMSVQNVDLMAFGPNMHIPLRRPSTGPGGAPAFPLSPPVLSFARGDAPSIIMEVDDSLKGSSPPPIVLNFCNYCSKQGTFRCNGCIKTFYCSALCHQEDWKAHRHMCLSKTAKYEGEKAKEIPCQQIVDGPSQTQTQPEPELRIASAVGASNAAICPKVFLVDLKKKNLAVGSKVEVAVVETHSPGRFFVHVQGRGMVADLQTVSLELQNASRAWPPASAYLPDQGEVCAVQFSMDMKWYRGLVQSVPVDQKTASILYIDFGNEEDVPLARIRPLDPRLGHIPPCATECCAAGVVPVSGIWSGKCCAVVKQLLTEQVVTLHVLDVVQSERVHVVEMMITAVGKRLSSFLVDQGYATHEGVAAKPSEKEIHGLVSASLENFRRQSSGKDENTEACPPEPLSQHVGDCFSALVTQVRSPVDMICQKVDNASEILELQKNLRDHCSSIPASLNFRPAPGTVCCSQFSDDNQWYRAQVLAYSSEDRVCVGYIDFGNTEEVELGRLRPLSAPLLALPMQAIPCSLAGVQPVREAWDDDCTLVLQQMLSNRILSVRIVGESKGTALVGMVDQASDPQADVAELLISIGYAAAATSPPDTEDTDTPGVEGAAAEEEAGEAADPLVWSSVELPCGGPMGALIVSSVQNPGEFYCVRSEPEALRGLEELGPELKLHCEGEASPWQAAVGQPCCALFTGDNSWYRALVKKVSEDKVLVYFVDYGNSAEVEKSNLRNLTAQLLTLPFQAIRCWLVGVEELGPAWTGEVLLRFHTAVSGQLLSGRALQLTERGYGLDLMSGGQSVAATLLGQKLAGLQGETAPAQATAPVAPLVTACVTHSAPPVAAVQEPAVGVPGLSTPAQQIPRVPPRKGPVKPAPAALASFPVDWRAVELPRESFRPRVAAVTSPALFYVLSPTKVEVECQQRMMRELAEYCSTRQASLKSSSSPGQERPPLGAACCALFSGDQTWYRAVVLETAENEASVLFMDHGNCETVPYSSLCPIPDHLLLLPFQITRCSLAGKECFPPDCPSDILMLLKSVLADCVTATVYAFDGFTNLLSIKLPREMGGGCLGDLILSQLELLTHPKTINNQAATTTKQVSSLIIVDGGPQPLTPNSHPTTTKVLEGHPTSSTTVNKVLEGHPTSSTTVNKVLEGHPTSRTAISKVLTGHINNSTTINKVLEALPTSPNNTPQVLKGNPTSPSTINKVLLGHPTSPSTHQVFGEGPRNAVLLKGLEVSGCCCNDLKTKMDRLEQLMENQIVVLSKLIELASC